MSDGGARSIRVICRPGIAAAFILAALLSGLIIIGGCGGEVSVDNGGATRLEDGVPLPEPVGEGGMSLNESLERRRSARAFSPEGLRTEEVSQLLWAAQGVTEPDTGFRTAPSAGALYPLELFVLQDGTLYQYRPASHSLDSHAEGVDPGSLAEAALGQSFIAEAPAVFVFTADYQRTRVKYGSRAERYVHMEAGHAAQNLLLEATAMGLAAVPVGAFEDERVRGVLGLPGELTPLYLIPVGRGG